MTFFVNSEPYAVLIYHAALTCESNIVALAHVMHSMADIFAHLMHDALDLKGLNEDSLTLNDVTKNLPTGDLKNAAVKVLGLRQSRYLNSLVSSVKHVKLIEANYTVDITGVSTTPHGLKLRAFVYKRNRILKNTHNNFLMICACYRKSLSC